MSTPAVWIGTSGWSYDHWNDVLYPAGTPSGKRFGIYVHEFPTVELNASFYRWPRPGTFASWQRRLPEVYRFSVKAARGLTHTRRLADPAEWVDRLVAGWRELGDKRGMMLFQLPPGLVRDDGLLDNLLERIGGRIPVAVEFRHPTWHDEEVLRILERHAAAYCVMSGAQLPCLLRATAPQVYVRWHGPSHDQLYAGSYPDADLHWWADRIDEWRAGGHEVFGYFNNDGAGHAVRNARTLRALIRT
ncbi:DUF72 domain-containing protein [Nakamurella sp. YIM 132087]|uniref:DUF72 domain-containing protein n=1 Tax=Nakamurella alba TaxID=2665158 RepID=A0A7K1FLD4_9ACTN|nr:DUF72 domain-containing protein [Nakamurella alba]MTD14918.1 DUF72 domain-containing protein [Nakamurella alba]